LFITSSLNEAGHATHAFAVLNGSVNSGKLAAERHGVGAPKLGYRSFASIYDSFRRNGMSHSQAIKRIDSFEKLRGSNCSFPTSERSARPTMVVVQDVQVPPIPIVWELGQPVSGVA
jgi:hypothetical protein